MQVMKIRIGITGPESSGKTTLANRLAEEFKACLVLEYSRAYFEQKLKKGEPYEYDLQDIEKIAKIQFELNEEVCENEIKICDTEMSVIKIWCEDKFGFCPKEVTEMHRLQKFDIILMCRPDIDWQKDPFRQDENRREELFQKYQNTLEESNIKYKIIEGQGENRLKSAIEKVNNLIYNKE